MGETLTMRRAILAAAIVLAGVPAAVSARSTIQGTTAVAPATPDWFDALTDAAKAAMQVDPRASLVQSVAAERLATASRSGRDQAIQVATARWLQGEAWLRLNDIARARRLIEGALRSVHLHAPGTKLEGDLLLSRGGIHSAETAVASALTDYQAAHEIFRTIDDPRSRAKALLLISALYGGGNDYENALRYSQQALDIYNADPGLLVSIYNNRGNAFLALDQPLKAEGQFSRALALARQMKSELLIASFISNIASARLAEGRLASADLAIREGMRATSTGEARSLRPHMLAVAAKASLMRGDRPAALRRITESFAGVDLAQTTLLDRDAHETAFRTFSALGRDDLALAHLVALKRIDDRATRLAASTNTALMGARFDFANQELRIAKLQRDDAQKTVAFERARARTQQGVFAGIVVATLAVIALLVFGMIALRRSRDKVRAANIDLGRTNAALEKALAAKTEFLATTSHEIRTPLNGILGMTQVMLADPRLDRGVHDRVGVVHTAGVTMRALVDDILDVAKMETGNLSIEMAPIDLRTTLREATRMWQAQALAKGLTFTLALDDCPVAVMGDAARLRQIVFNLLSNAVKFTATGGVAIAAARAGDRVRVTIADTGVGIDPRHHEEIFESFRQADAGTTRQFGGTGLGLTICRNLSRAMGGDVTVDSAAGAGARFVLDLPLVEAPAVTADAEPTETMLLVDRSPIARAMIRTLLQPHTDIPIVAVATLAEASAAVAAGGVTRILLDDAVASDDPDTVAAICGFVAQTRVPVAILTTRDADTRAAYATSGAAPVLTKPIAKDMLVAALFEQSAGSDGTPMPLVSQAA